MSDRPDRVQVYPDDAGEYRWRRIAPNGEVVSDSGEGYVVESHARDAAHRANGDDVVYEFEETG